MEDNASSKLTSLLDSLPKSGNKSAAIEEISIVLSAVTPASLRAIVPNLSFNIVFECLASCSRYAIIVESSCDLPCDLPCAASLAGIQPVRPRAQRTSP